MPVGGAVLFYSACGLPKLTGYRETERHERCRIVSLPPQAFWPVRLPAQTGVLELFSRL